MIHIDPTHIKIIEAKDKHLKNIKCRVLGKLGQPCRSDANCKICKVPKIKYKSTNALFGRLINFLLDGNNLENLIVGDPATLMQLNNNFYSAVLKPSQINKLPGYLKEKSIKKKKQNTVIHNLVMDIQRIFDYKWFVSKSKKDQYSAYHLAENLNRRSCTYCNRTYTTTMCSNKVEKLMRPQFDHWYPQIKYPLLALSFYNLIPSCYTCNSSVKGDKELNLTDHIHPYADPNQTNEFRFSYFLTESLDKYHVFIQPELNGRKTVNTLNELKIGTMYNAHHAELSDLIKIKQSYSDKYIEKIAEFFPNNGLSKEETYRLLFGTELDAKDFHKRPMSKFKYDILKELGIIV